MTEGEKGGFEGRNHCYGKWNTEMESFLKGKWRKVYIKDERRDCGSYAQCNFRRVDLTPVMESCEYVSLHRLLRRNTICLFEMFGKIKNLAEEKTLSDRTKGRKNLLRFVFFSFETMQNVERTKIFRAKPILRHKGIRKV